MANKVVKNFSHPKSFGFTGSRGMNMVGPFMASSMPKKRAPKGQSASTNSMPAGTDGTFKKGGRC